MLLFDQTKYIRVGFEPMFSQNLDSEKGKLLMQCISSSAKMLIGMIWGRKKH